MSVGLTAAVITAISVVSGSWPWKEHVDFHEDMVMSELDAEPLHQALHLMEHVFQTLLTGSLIEKRMHSVDGPGHSWHGGAGINTSLLVRRTSLSRIGVLAPGPRAWSCRPSRRSQWAMAPWRSGTG